MLRYAIRLKMYCSNVILIVFSQLCTNFVSSRHDGTDSPADAGDVKVVINSFHSKIIKVRVSLFLRYMYSVEDAARCLQLLNRSAAVVYDAPGFPRLRFMCQNNFRHCLIKIC